MTDDLVKRLRGNHDNISHEDIYESADRIEQDAQHIDEMYALVAAMNADHTASKTRIEKLKAALRLYACEKTCPNCYGEVQHTRYCGWTARTALEGENLT